MNRLEEYCRRCRKKVPLRTEHGATVVMWRCAECGLLIDADFEVDDGMAGDTVGFLRDERTEGGD